MGGGGKGGGGGTEVYSSAPEWMQDVGKWSSEKFKDQMGKQESYQPYPEMKNPFGQWESLFSNETGKSYLDSFSAAPKAAYEQALTDTKNMFGARGTYGSAGNGLMSGAMASAGSNYATAMADAQQKAQNAQAMDYYTSAEGQKWANQNKADALNYENTMRQQLISNYLSSMGILVPTLGQSQVVEQDSGGGGKGGAGAMIGGAATMAGMFKSDRAMKKGIVLATSALDRLCAVPVYEYSYKDGQSGVRHTGPMAQDWSAKFGGPEKAIVVQDMLGVLMKAVQELAAELKQIRKEAANAHSYQEK